MTHTPGPWKSHYYNCMIRGRSDQAHICDIRGFGVTDEEAAGNARLIAAAPELLDACKLAFEACQDNLRMYMYKNEPLLLEAFEACQAAINLATKGHAAQTSVLEEKASATERSE